MAKLYTRVYEFGPFAEEVTALHLDARRRSTGLYVCDVTWGRTLVPEEGVAYIECARTPSILRYRGLNVHKVGALQVTLALSALKDLKDYGGTPTRYNVE